MNGTNFTIGIRKVFSMHFQSHSFVYINVGHVRPAPSNILTNCGIVVQHEGQILLQNKKLVCHIYKTSYFWRFKKG